MMNIVSCYQSPQPVLTTVPVFSADGRFVQYVRNFSCLPSFFVLVDPSNTYKLGTSPWGSHLAKGNKTRHSFR